MGHLETNLPNGKAATLLKKGNNGVYWWRLCQPQWTELLQHLFRTFLLP